MSADHEWVAGVDGCKGGWVVVLHDLARKSYASRVVSTFASVLRLPEAPCVIAVDVPIGLLTSSSRGGRACEVQARQFLGKRASSVFSAPTRNALTAFRAGGDYQLVSTANRGGVESAPGLSRQTFGILPKIDEVDRLLTSAAQNVVHEVHPELCFAQANGGSAMTHSKKKAAGRSERLALLTRLGFTTPIELPRGARWDDLLDACIACWTAARIASGAAVRLPTAPAIDARGLRMDLWR